MWGSYINIKEDEMGDIVSLRPISKDDFIERATQTVLYDVFGNSMTPSRKGMASREMKTAYIAHFEALDMLIEAQIVAYETNLSSLEIHHLNKPDIRTVGRARNNIEIILFEGWGGRGRKTFCEDTIRLTVQMGKIEKFRAKGMVGRDYSQMSRLRFAQEFRNLLNFHIREVKNGFLSVKENYSNNGTTTSTLKSTITKNWDFSYERH